MAYMAHPAAGVHRIPDVWLDGFAPSGFRLATARQVAAWHAERGLEPPDPDGEYCPSCLKRVPAAAAERRLHREVCASGPLLVWLFHCPACDTAIAAEVVEGDAPRGSD
jgi:hypothetical protein